MKRAFTSGIFIAVAAGAGFIAGFLLAPSSNAPGNAAVRTSVASTPAHPRGKGKILYWWDPMIGPSSISPKPGVSAMGMKLVPVYAHSNANVPGEVTISPAIEQDLAVQTSRVRRGALHKTVRTVGYFREELPTSFAVTLRTSGWIGVLYASTNGTVIHKGEPLFTLYSPQLLAAEEELLAAAKSSALARQTHNAASIRVAQQIYHAIRRRLVYFGVNISQLDQIVAQGTAREYLTFVSPVSGILEHIALRQRSYVNGGRTVMRIAQLGTVWLDAQIYENQLPWVRLGQLVKVRVAADPGQTLTGRVFYVAPTENPKTHTVTVRARFANPEGELRPGMYASVDILTTPLKNVLLAPTSAVIHTGTRQIVLVAKGGGHFAPYNVVTGLAGSDGRVQILKGLRTGQRVVTSGQFLIDVESNMSELTQKLTARGQSGKHLEQGRTAGAHMKGMKMRPVEKQDPVRQTP